MSSHASPIISIFSTSHSALFFKDFGVGSDVEDGDDLDQSVGNDDDG